MPQNDAPPLDAFDRKILEHYQHDTRAPAQKIGEAVGLSAAAVQRRLRAMREAGVIVAEVAQIAPERVGFPLTCIVGVRLERESRAENLRFQKRIARSRYVQQCYSVTGDVDYVLVVLARDMQDFQAFAEEALSDDANVRSFTTYVSLDRVKVGTSTPIEGVAGE
ncbi:MAG TPA: Lrp/AsnC family transcriptional regulator [Polyangiaceae bacterium]|jgi:DNA-binding Lrp family transcriptional regulator